MREEVIWTNLSVVEISKRLEEEYQIKVSKTVIYKLLKKHKYGPATGPVDEQELKMVRILTEMLSPDATFVYLFTYITLRLTPSL